MTLIVHIFHRYSFRGAPVDAAVGTRSFGYGLIVGQQFFPATLIAFTPVVEVFAEPSTGAGCLLAIIGQLELHRLVGGHAEIDALA